MHFNKIHSKKAFTLTELLVVISIISIMAVMAIPAFNNYEKINALRLTAEEIQNMLLQAQSLAIGPRNSSDASGNKYYQFHRDDRKLLVEYQSGTGSASRTDIIRNGAVESRSTISNFSTDLVKFKVPGGAIDPTGGIIHFIIKVDKPGDNRKRCVRIDPNTRNIQISKMYSFSSIDDTSNYGECDGQF